MMPHNKLVIRRLPPFMSEDEFLKQVSPLPDHDYFCFFEANSGLGPHAYSRAYINFSDSNDVAIFRERFDNYIFLDKDGHEYPAVVEQALWHKSPTNGPFFKNVNLDKGDEPQVAGAPSSEENSEKPSNWIEQDSQFIEFMEKLQAQKKKPRHSPIQTLETNLDELTNATSGVSSGNKDNSKVITPLIGYVNQKRTMKGNRKAR